MIVRTARAGDIDQMVTLLNEIIAVGGTTAKEDPVDAVGFHDYIFASDVVGCFVAEDDGQILGFQKLNDASYLPDGVGDIATFVRLGLAQKGVGAALFVKTLNAAKTAGLRSINATIRADNTGGLRYYTKLGFEDHGIDRDVPLKDGTPVDRISKRFDLKA